MANFQLGLRTSNVTTNQAILEIIAGSRGARLRTFNISLATGVTGVIGMGRPAVAGITPATLSKFQADDGVGVSDTIVALTWGTSPTAPSVYHHRVSVPATVGALRDIMPSNSERGQGIWIPPGTTLVLFNITGGPTLDVSMDLSE